MNNNQIVQKDDKDSKKIFTMIVLVLTLMICTTGATYAFFAINASSNNVITGTAANASLEFSVAPTPTAPSVASYQTKPMIPQYSLQGTTNVLQSAVTGTTPTGENSAISCVDANGNTVCKVYTFTIKNSSTATAKIKGQIKFFWNETLTNGKKNNLFTNLKWKLMDSATTVTIAAGNIGATATMDFVNFVTDVTLAPNATQQYYMIFWIEETGSSQNETDYGTWNATIQFVNNVDNSGLTSTITS